MNENATPRPDPLPHIPQPSDICSVCGRGLVHVIPSLDPAHDRLLRIEAAARATVDRGDRFYRDRGPSHRRLWNNEIAALREALEEPR